jgi:hypothetical protein
VAAAIFNASGCPDGRGGGGPCSNDVPWAFAMMGESASEAAPYPTNRRRDNLCDGPKERIMLVFRQMIVRAE